MGFHYSAKATSKLTLIDAKAVTKPRTEEKPERLAISCEPSEHANGKEMIFPLEPRGRCALLS